MSPREDRGGVEFPRILTIRQAAKLLTVSERTVKTWVAHGMLPSILMGQRCRRILQSDLVAFVESRRVAAVKPRRAR